MRYGDLNTISEAVVDLLIPLCRWSLVVPR